MDFETRPVCADTAPVQPAAPARSHSASDITIACYENLVPPYIEMEMDQLYQTLNSSLMHYAVRQKAIRAHTYVARNHAQAVAIFLFKRTKRKVSVVNEMIEIPAEELQRFANFIFSTYPTVEVISFSLIGKDVTPLSFPFHQHDGSEDIVLALPATPDTYLESLSPKTRRNIRRYLRAIERDNPTLRHISSTGKEINEEHLHALIQLKRQNIDAKNLKFGLADEELDWIVRQAKISGQASIVLIGDKVCGGSINLRIHDHFFGQIIAYDRAYHKYGLGILCTYLTICDQIRLGAKESHLCWGRYQYKYKLAGVQRDRASLDIYRSRAAYCRNAGVIIAKTIKTALQEWKKRLLEMEHKEGSVAVAGAVVVRLMRKLKRSRIAA